MRLSILLVLLLTVGGLVVCGPREPDTDPPAIEPASPIGSIPAPEKLSPAVTSEVDRDRDPGPSAEDVPHSEDLMEELPIVEEPIQVGPGVTPPRRIEGSGPIEGLHELFESGNYALGTCIFRLTISETGEVKAVDFLKPSEVVPEVRSSILEATKEWRFEPATQDGRPVAVSYFISVSHCPVEPRNLQEP